MADKQTRVNLNPADAPEGGGVFQGGETRIVSHRFRMGYPMKDGSVSNPDLPTLVITHVPKASGEERREILSCGNKARGMFKVREEGRSLKATGDVTAPNRRSSAMIYLASLVKAGVPESRLASGLIDFADGITVKMALQPLDLSGLEGGGDTPKTVPVVKEILKAPWDNAGKGKAKAAPADNDADDDEDADDKADADASDDDEDAEADAEDADADEDTSKDDDDADADDDEDEENASSRRVDDRTVLAELKTLLQKSGGSLKRTKLGSTAMAALRTHPQRNAVVTRMVTDEFLASAKGIRYDRKTGLVALK